MLQCPVYETLRQKYLPRKYHIFPDVNKFNILMSSHSETVIHNVATYFYYAFKGCTLNFLFILRCILTNLDLVAYRLRYYFRKVLNGLKHFMTKIKSLIESKD